MNLINTIIQKVHLQTFNSGIWAAMGIHAIRTTGFSISFTYLPLYLYQQRHISMTVVGLVLLISGIASGIFQVLGGILADRFGHRRMFVVFQLIETAMFALLAVSIGMNASIWLIFTASVMVWIFGGMSAPTISAMVLDISQTNRLNESYGLMAIGQNLGWAIGPLTGGFLQSHTSYAWVFGIGAAVISFSLIGAIYLPRDAVRKPVERLSKNYLKLVLSDANLIAFCVICMLFFLEMGQWGATLSVFTVDRIGFTPQQYGLLMSISGIIIMIFQYPISRQIEWLSSRKALFLGSVLYGLGFLSFSWVKSFLPAIGSIVILVIGEMLFVPASYSTIGKLSETGNVAKNMGILGLSGTIGSSIGPLLGGFLLDKFPTEPLYVWGPIALPAFFAAFGFLLWRGYSKNKIMSGTTI